MLSIVATPIGNLGDITMRALNVLREADLILCEDTRVTRKLLSHYDIHTRTESFHAHTKEEKLERFIALLAEGGNLALVTDAGTPGISDPGSRLVSLLYKRFGSHPTDGVSVVAVPGPSAVIAALSISGFPVSDFLFLGFLPHKKGRKTLFEEVASSSRAVVLYESPHRILKTLEALSLVIGERPIAVARELTKVYEEVIIGTAAEVLDGFTRVPKRKRGEFVVMISPRVPTRG